MRAFRDGTLHPFRRRRAARILRETPHPRSVLFLCTGNICRSPYAEKVFARFLPDGEATLVEISSAGFLAANRRSPEQAIATAAHRSVALDAHRSRTLDGSLLSQADLVIAMERVHLRRLRTLQVEGRPPAILLGDLDLETPRRREIQDPWGHPTEVFEASFDRIDRCLVELAQLAYGGEVDDRASPSRIR